MNSLKEINLINVLNNTEFEKIIDKLNHEKVLEIFECVDWRRCTYCRCIIRQHSKCIKCNKKTCFVLTNNNGSKKKCLECLKDKKFKVLIEKNILRRIKCKKYYLIICYLHHADTVYECDYEGVIDLLVNK